MEAISVFDMLKIGVGPSSSHTLGPWRAAQAFIQELKEKDLFHHITQVQAHLYGSLALTGHGHGTDVAILLGLSGQDPVTMPLERVQTIPEAIKNTGSLILNNERPLAFDYLGDLIFHYDKCLHGHANGMKFEVYDQAR
jgi:L-serine dehydratase